MSKNAVMPLTDYQNACDAIREKTETTALIKSGELPEKIDDVFEKGKQSNYDIFWDAFQLNGERRWYWGAFAGPGWTDTTFKPKYPIIIQGTSGYCFRSSWITRIPRIELLEDRVTQIFYDAIRCHTIDCFALPNGSVSFTNTFSNCINLENIIIEGEIGGNGFNISASTKLTHDSLMSIIHALKDFSTLQTIESCYLTTTHSIIDMLALEKGKTYIATLAKTSYGQITAYEFEDASGTAEMINVDGVGEVLGVHYVKEHDNYSYNLVIYNDGVDESTGVAYLREYRYVHDYATGNIFSMPTIPSIEDMLTLKTKIADASHTVTLGTTNLYKLDETEKVIATEKGWTLL